VWLDAPSQEPELLAHRAATGWPLEVCQSSNLATRAVASLEEQPLGAFRDASVTVTINSDDPPMFDTTLNREYEVVAGLLDPDEAGLAELARVAVRDSFAGDAVKFPDPRRDRRLGKRLGTVVRPSARCWYNTRRLNRSGQQVASTYPVGRDR
jgi:hypothetical protein